MANELAFRPPEQLHRIGSPFLSHVGPNAAMPPHKAPDPGIVVAPQTDAEPALPVSAVGLLVEVSRTTLRRDLTIKRDVYARAGVPEYWWSTSISPPRP